MTRFRPLVRILGVVALLLLTMGAAAAQGRTPTAPHGKPNKPGHSSGRPARLVWTPATLTQTVTPGQTVQVTASFVSSADLTDATLVIRGGLGRLMTVTSDHLTVQAGTPTTVTFTITMPAQGAHNQSGVVQVRAGHRVLATPLHVHLKVPTTQDTSAEPSDDDAASSHQ